MIFHIFSNSIDDKYDLLATWCEGGHLGILAGSFLDQVGSILQTEARGRVCTNGQQTHELRFKTLAQLCKIFCNSIDKRLDVDCAVACVVQLCHYIE